MGKRCFGKEEKEREKTGSKEKEKQISVLADHTLSYKQPEKYTLWQPSPPGMIVLSYNYQQFIICFCIADVQDPTFLVNRGNINVT